MQSHKEMSLRKYNDTQMAAMGTRVFTICQTAFPTWGCWYSAMSFFHSLLVERLDFLAVEADVCVRFVPILITNAAAFLCSPKALNIRKWCFNPHQMSEFKGSGAQSHAHVT